MKQSAAPTQQPSINIGVDASYDGAGRIETLHPLPFNLERRRRASVTLCIVVPVFNEESALGHTYAAIAGVLDSLDVEATILFVNDGSRDGTVSVLEDLYQSDQRVSYLLLSRNFGHQAALTAGLDHADADIVVSMDADLQHPPELLSVLIDAWTQGYDVVHTRKLTTVSLSPIRTGFTRLAYALIRRVSRVPIIPQASDYRLLDRQVVNAVRSLRESGRLYRGLTPWVGFRQCVVPYVAGPRAAGTSQYGMGQLISLLARALFDFSSLPLHIGLLLGGAAMVLSTLYLLFILAWIVLGEHTPPGWASTVGVTLFLNSIILAFLGIIGVYVARVYDEVRARPSYVISRVREHNNSRHSRQE